MCPKPVHGVLHNLLPGVAHGHKGPTLDGSRFEHCTFAITGCLGAGDHGVQRPAQHRLRALIQISPERGPLCQGAAWRRLGYARMLVPILALTVACLGLIAVQIAVERYMGIGNLGAGD